MREANLNLILWNEPRSPQTTFRAYLESAERFLVDHFAGDTPVTLLGHSFGAHAVRHLCKTHPDKIQKSVIISSDLSLPTTDVNMLNLTRLDYQQNGDPRAERLGAILQQYSGSFDENTLQGFALIAENPRLFEHYWFNRNQMTRFLRRYSGSNALDVERFVSIRRSFFDIELRDSPIPCLAIFGRHEVVVARDIEIKILKQAFNDLTVVEFENTAHYPHIENTSKFIEVLKNALSDDQNQPH